jgi:hypothetical protein
MVENYMIVCGLDSSTVTSGISLCENGKITFASFADTSKFETNKDKIFHIIETFRPQFESADVINLESALGSFSFGFSNQKTIVLLARFNGILEYVLNETFPNKKIQLVNVNTCRKKVFGRCRIKGIKGKEFVQMELERILPNLHTFDKLNKKNLPDKRNSDIYDSICLSLYG